MATSGDKFRISCVLVAATYAFLRATPLAVVGILAVWLVCTSWVMRAYVSQRKPGFWLALAHVGWLQISIILCLVFVSYLSTFTGGFDPWLVY